MKNKLFIILVLFIQACSKSDYTRTAIVYKEYPVNILSNPLPYSSSDSVVVLIQPTTNIYDVRRMAFAVYLSKPTDTLNINIEWWQSNKNYYFKDSVKMGNTRELLYTTRSLTYCGEVIDSMYAIVKSNNSSYKFKIKYK
jgi:GH15 family glucan-1,4-alpha-glucosidase